jgi:hypothetical protein
MKRIDILLLIVALVGVITLAFGLPTLAAAEPQPQEEGNNGLWAVNIYRAQAGVAPVVGDPLLTSQCMLHATYMAQNQVASLTEDETLAFYSSEGSLCAGKALIYLLPANPQYMKADQTVEAWMNSPTHRMWLLYPTLAAVGFGYTVSSFGDKWVTSSAMDVLSGIDFITRPNRFGCHTASNHDLVAICRTGTRGQPECHYADNLSRGGCSLHG